MRGKVSFEEAYEIPALADSSRDQAALYIAPNDLERYLSQVKHPIGERLELSNKHGIGYTIWSLTVPGCQGIADKTRTEKYARGANDWIANEINDHRDRKRMPQDFWRTNHWLRDVERPLVESRGDTMCKKDLLYYFKNNIYLTTSGHFATEVVKFVADYVGADRVLFSVDSPYEKVQDGASWYDNDEEALSKALGGKENYVKVGENAKKLFKLGKYHDSNA